VGLQCGGNAVSVHEQCSCSAVHQVEQVNQWRRARRHARQQAEDEPSVDLGPGKSRDAQGTRKRTPSEEGVRLILLGRAGNRLRAGSSSYAVNDGQRTVTTMDSDSASHEWSIPGPHVA
jgi:hypothetical protein